MHPVKSMAIASLYVSEFTVCANYRSQQDQGGTGIGGLLGGVLGSHVGGRIHWAGR